MTKTSKAKKKLEKAMEKSKTKPQTSVPRDRDWFVVCTTADTNKFLQNIGCDQEIPRADLVNDLVSNSDRTLRLVTGLVEVTPDELEKMVKNAESAGLDFKVFHKKPEQKHLSRTKRFLWCSKNLW